MNKEEIESSIAYSHSHFEVDCPYCGFRVEMIPLERINSCPKCQTSLLNEIESNLNRIKESIMKQRKNVIDKQLLTTSYYPTTSNYTLHSWGGFFPDIKLYIEQIQDKKFLFNLDGFKGIQTVKYGKDENKKRIMYLSIDGKDYPFNTKEIYEPVYNVPSIIKAQEYISEKLKTREFNEIIKDIESNLKVLYDFKFNTDLSIIKLFIAQSYLSPLLEAVFYLGIDATKGGGKTTLLELISLLSRHGYLSGDISPSAIPRYVDQLQLSIAVDELDQKIGDSGQEEVTSILRKGQRRNNYYTRCEGRNNVPKRYSIFGSHSFSYRSEVEDAFSDRTIPIHAGKSKDNKLPILNLFKNQILKSLADELFFWCMDNLSELYIQSRETCSNVVSVVGCNGTSRTKDIEKVRLKLFSILTKQLTENAMKILGSVTGRNAELSYIALNIANIVKIDVNTELKNVMKIKEESEVISESYYLDALETVLRKKCVSLKEEGKLKSDGLHIGKPYYQKNLMYQEFVQYLKDLQIMSIGTKKYNSLLRDLGFMQGDTIINIRVDKIPRMCLVFSDQIQNRINVIKIKKDPEAIDEEYLPDPTKKDDLIREIKANPKHNKQYINFTYNSDLIQLTLREGDIVDIGDSYDVVK